MKFVGSLALGSVLLLMASLSTSCRKESGTADRSAAAQVKASSSPEVARAPVAATRKDRPERRKDGEVVTLDDVRSTAELQKWFAARLPGGILSEDERRGFSEALERIAKEQGIEKHEAVARFLTSSADKAFPDTACFELCQALRKEPMVFARGAEKALPGRLGKMAIVSCASILSQLGEVASLDTLYTELAPGDARSQVAGTLAIALCRQDGFPAALERVRQMETLDERRGALIDLSNEIAGKGGDAISAEDVQRLYADADGVGLGWIVRENMKRGTK